MGDSLVTGNYGGAITQGVIFISAIVAIAKDKKVIRSSSNG